MPTRTLDSAAPDEVWIAEATAPETFPAETPEDPEAHDPMQMAPAGGPDAQSESVGSAPVPPHEEARIEFETWSRRRQDLEVKVADRTAQLGAAEALITQARRDVILGKAEMGAAAPLVADRTALQAEIVELGELVAVAFTEEKAAQLRYGEAHARARVGQLRSSAADLADRAVASDERIDTALAEFLAALEARWQLFEEGQQMVASAASGDNAAASQGWPEVGRLDQLRDVPLDWKRIPHTNATKYPRHYHIDL
jgi:hypothetical protein